MNIRKPKTISVMSNNNDLSHHILPNSATMVGVCIMVISIVKSIPPRRGELFYRQSLGG
ncbi:MAG: hypothetical protein NTZ70_00995 [Methylococcales bacterium]|nr:hypothetical protein [Methylococcales bacterium]